MGACPLLLPPCTTTSTVPATTPELVVDVLDVALADEEVVAHLVHPETTFDAAEVRRHVTVLVLTPTRLVVAHVDDHPADSEHPSASASATTEAVPLARADVGRPDPRRAAAREARAPAGPRRSSPS